MRSLPYDIRRKMTGRGSRTPLNRADRRRSLSARANATAHDKRRAALRRALNLDDTTPSTPHAPDNIGENSAVPGKTGMGSSTFSNPGTTLKSEQQVDPLTGGISSTPQRKQRLASRHAAARRVTTTQLPGTMEPPIYTPHANKPWCTEHDKLVAPVLRKAHPDDIVVFRAKYLRYCEQVEAIREKHSITTLVPKSIYNCIERANRYYICAVSDLLPEEHRGHPDDVDHAVLHDLVMNAHDLVSDSYTAALEDEVRKIVINVGGKHGEQSIQQAWLRLYELREIYQCDIPAKTVVKGLLQNLKPKATRKVIRALQKGGKAHQRRTAADIYAFHHWIVDIARTNRKAHEFNSTIDDNTNGKGLTARQAKTRNKSQRQKRTTPSEAAVLEGGCSHHGKDSLHGSSECWELHSNLAPDWYPEFQKRRKARNAKRAAKRKAQRKAEGAKQSTGTAKAVKERNTEKADVGKTKENQHSDDSDSSNSDDGGAYQFFARAYSMRTVSIRRRSPRSLTNNNDSDITVDDAEPPVAEERRTLDLSGWNQYNTGEEGDDENSCEDSDELSFDQDHNAADTSACKKKKESVQPTTSVSLTVSQAVRHTRMRLNRIAANEEAHDLYQTVLQGNQLAIDTPRASGVHMPLAVIKRSPINGLGLFANTHIAAGTYLGRYHGSIVADLGFNERSAGVLADEITRTLPDGPHNHLLMLRNRHGMMQLVNGKDTVLGCMNHSDKPNVHGNINGEFTTIVPIPSGTEIVINYSVELTAETSSEDNRVESEDDDSVTDSEHDNDDDSEGAPDSRAREPSAPARAQKPEVTNARTLTQTMTNEHVDKVSWADDDALSTTSEMILFDNALRVLGHLPATHSTPNYVHRARITGKRCFSNPNMLYKQAGMSTQAACWMLPRQDKQLWHNANMRLKIAPTRTSLLSRAVTGNHAHAAEQYGTPRDATVCALPTGKNAAIWDSGASHHLTGVIGEVTCKQKPDIAAITDIQGEHSPVVAMGTLGNLRHVLVVPNATQTLLSVGSYLDQFGGSLTFTSQKVTARCQGTGVRTVGVRQEDGLYYLMRRNPAPLRATANLGKEQIRFQLLRERIHELHRCFGHVGKRRLRIIIQNNKIDGIAPHHVELLTECESCSLGKLNKIAAPKLSATPKPDTFGTHLASDNSGKLPVRSIGGCRYANITVCMATNWVWATPMVTLKHTFRVLRHIIEVDLHQEHDHEVRLLRSDGGTDYCNSKVDHLLRTHGIERQTTCVETSHQNGKAERYVGIMFAMLRTFLCESRLPPRFWSEALCAAAFVHNRMPLSASADKNQKSPYELRYGRPPDLSQLRPFGTRCTTVLIKRKRRGKHLPRTQRGIMVGYGYMQGKKGYRVYIPSTGKVIVTRHVRFATLFKSVRARRNGTPANLYTTEAEVVRMLDTLELAADVSTMGSDTQISKVAENDLTSATGSSDSETSSNSPEDEEQSQDESNSDEIPSVSKAHNHHKHEVELDQDVPKGWITIPEDHPYLQRDKQVDMGSGETIAERMKSRKQKYSNTNYVSDCLPNFLALSAGAVMDMAEDHETPKTYRQAMKSKDKVMWADAVREELNAIKRMGCYTELQRHQVPEGANIIGFTWVFKVKKNGDGTVARFKARICCDGSRQKRGIDFDETFAPVANATTIRLVLAVATHKQLKLRQYDIKLAFVSTKIDRPVYMYQPTGGTGARGTVWQLKKSLYGLKQAPKLFNDHLHQVLTKKCKFRQSKHDPCLYIYNTKQVYTLLALVVDDLLLATNDETHADKFKQTMEENFDFKDMGVPNYMIGMNLTTTENTLQISQKEYIRDIIKRFEAKTLAPTTTPATTFTHLVKTGVSGEAESPPCNSKVYRSLVGALMYVLITRPDAATAISIAARFLHDPRRAHLNAALYILRYLKGSISRCLTYTRTKDPTLVAYCDASWADDRDSRRSRYGYLIYYGAALISWKSKLHAALCLSTSEAEYVAATETTKEISWLRLMLKDINLPQAKATTIHEDNQACIKMATNNMVSARNKHLELKMHYVREQIQKKTIALVYTPTNQQLADALTKNLPRPSFETFREEMLNPKQTANDSELNGHPNM